MLLPARHKHTQNLAGDAIRREIENPLRNLFSEMEFSFCDREKRLFLHRKMADENGIILINRLRCFFFCARSFVLGGESFPEIQSSALLLSVFGALSTQKRTMIYVLEEVAVRFSGVKC